MVQTLAIDKLTKSPEDARTKPGKPVAKLDSLTSLRFFAAALIVISHAVPAFFPGTTVSTDRIALAQGVSFFFVLSGFILTYVYPGLDSAKSCFKFWRARFARVWPVHVFALLLSCPLLVITMGVPRFAIIAANLCMVQGWILKVQYYFSINPPAWSISTEFFFYLLFPWLVKRLEKSWPAKLLLSAGIVLACVVLTGLLNFPEFTQPTQVSSRSLIYINPLVRLFEFVLGMCAAIWWRHAQQSKAQPNATAMSCLEVSAIALIAFYMLNIDGVYARLSAGGAFNLALGTWLKFDGNCFFFAALIMVCAFQKGMVSKLLANKFFVWLGEISYSLYLLHFSAIHLYEVAENACKPLIATLGPWWLFAIYWCIVITASHFTYKYIESPLRAWIGGSGKKGRQPLTPQVVS